MKPMPHYEIMKKNYIKSSYLAILLLVTLCASLSQLLIPSSPVSEAVLLSGKSTCGSSDIISPIDTQKHPFLAKKERIGELVITEIAVAILSAVAILYVMELNNITNLSKSILITSPPNTLSSNRRYPSQKTNTDFLLAAKTQELCYIEWYLKEGADINTKNQFVETALMLNVWEENSYIIELSLIHI